MVVIQSESSGGGQRNVSHNMSLIKQKQKVCARARRVLRTHVGEEERMRGEKVGEREAVVWRWRMQMIDDFTAGLDNSSKQI